MTRIFSLGILFLALLQINGCSLSKIAMSKVSATLTGSSNVFMGDDDPELIRDALPFTIKFYESLAQKDSLNPALLETTGKLFCLYAQAFVQFPADTLHDSLKAQKKAMGKRAKKLFLRGRDYALKALEVKYPGITASIKSGSADSAIALTNISDTSTLYWCGISWMAAIRSDRSDLALAMTTKRALAIMTQVLNLNQSFDNGGVHEFFCSYYATAPKALGGNDSSSLEHYQKAIDISDGKKVSPYVSYATSLCIKLGDKKTFNEVLNKAAKLNIRTDKNTLLQNTIYQQHAKWLLENQNRFFKEDVPVNTSEPQTDTPIEQ
ncbi:MAG: TRAP transporter TatT component family protein [Fibrobacter sp.]|nr:TRAP transporter TatT component family protein [Fibrobacter sp.]